MSVGRKATALMIIIEKIISRHHQGHIRLDEETFKLFEVAKRINYADTEEEFQGAIANLISPVPDYLKSPVPISAGIRIVKTVTIIIGGGRTTDQIIEAAKRLEGRNRPSSIHSDITQANMPSGHGRRRPVILEFFEFDHDPTTEEVRARCEEPGCGYPHYEDGLRFQEDHPDDQRERHHIFIPENPWCDAHDYPQALNFWSFTGGRELGLRCCCLGDGWYLRYLFARRKYIF